MKSLSSCLFLTLILSLPLAANSQEPTGRKPSAEVLSVDDFETPKQPKKAKPKAPAAPKKKQEKKPVSKPIDTTPERKTLTRSEINNITNTISNLIRFSITNDWDPSANTTATVSSYDTRFEININNNCDTYCNKGNIYKFDAKELDPDKLMVGDGTGVRVKGILYNLFVSCKYSANCISQTSFYSNCVGGDPPVAFSSNNLAVIHIKDRKSAEDLKQAFTELIKGAP